MRIKSVSGFSLTELMMAMGAVVVLSLVVMIGVEKSSHQVNSAVVKQNYLTLIKDLSGLAMSSHVCRSSVINTAGGIAFDLTAAATATGIPITVALGGSATPVTIGNGADLDAYKLDNVNLFFTDVRNSGRVTELGVPVFQGILRISAQKQMGPELFIRQMAPVSSLMLAVNGGTIEGCEEFGSNDDISTCALDSVTGACLPSGSAPAASCPAGTFLSSAAGAAPVCLAFPLVCPVGLIPTAITAAGAVTCSPAVVATTTTTTTTLPVGGGAGLYQWVVRTTEIAPGSVPYCPAGNPPLGPNCPQNGALVCGLDGSSGPAHFGICTSLGTVCKIHVPPGIGLGMGGDPSVIGAFDGVVSCEPFF